MMGKDIKKLQELINKLETLVEEENQREANEQAQNTNTIQENTVNELTNNI